MVSVEQLYYLFQRNDFRLPTRAEEFEQMSVPSRAAGSHVPVPSADAGSSENVYSRIVRIGLAARRSQGVQTCPSGNGGQQTTNPDKPLSRYKTPDTEG